MGSTPVKPSKPSGSGGEPPLDHPDSEPKVLKIKGSSRASRRLEDVEERLTKSVRRVAKAVDKGVDTYIEARDKSARHRKDGVIVDFYENVSKGVARTISDSAPVITDFAEALNSRQVRKGIRALLRGAPVFWFAPDDDDDDRSELVGGAGNALQCGVPSNAPPALTSPPFVVCGSNSGNSNWRTVGYACSAWSCRT